MATIAKKHHFTDLNIQTYLEEENYPDGHGNDVNRYLYAVDLLFNKLCKNLKVYYSATDDPDNILNIDGEIVMSKDEVSPDVIDVLCQKVSCRIIFENKDEAQTRTFESGNSDNPGLSWYQAMCKKAEDEYNSITPGDLTGEPEETPRSKVKRFLKA